MDGYVAVTHGNWFAHLAQRTFWDEVNFWRPSAYHRFLGKPGSPFFFKLHAPANAIGGFGLVASFSRLPDWLAWEFFGEGNGAASLEDLKARINQIKTKNKLIGTGSTPRSTAISLELGRITSSRSAGMFYMRLTVRC